MHAIATQINPSVQVRTDVTFKKHCTVYAFIMSSRAFRALGPSFLLAPLPCFSEPLRQPICFLRLLILWLMCDIWPSSVDGGSLPQFGSSVPKILPPLSAPLTLRSVIRWLWSCSTYTVRDYMHTIFKLSQQHAPEA